MFGDRHLWDGVFFGALMYEVLNLFLNVPSIYGALCLFLSY